MDWQAVPQTSPCLLRYITTPPEKFQVCREKEQVKRINNHFVNTPNILEFWTLLISTRHIKMFSLSPKMYQVINVKIFLTVVQQQMHD